MKLKPRDTPRLGIAKAFVLGLLLAANLPLSAHAQQQRPAVSHGDDYSNLYAKRKSTWVEREPDPYLPDLREHDSFPKHPKKAAHDPNVRALEPVAPASRRLSNDDDDRAVRAHPVWPSGSKPESLSSRLPARSLQDWQVEDIVLLATVDGYLYARDRKTGAHRWDLFVERPMVETTYHNKNESAARRNANKESHEDYVWIVEPTQNGNLYGYMPGSDLGVQRLGLTVKQLVDEKSPWEVEDPPVIYNGAKKSYLYTVDTRTGTIISASSSDGSTRIEDNICRRVGGFDPLEDTQCGAMGTLKLGRTEYTVSISSAVSGKSICTIRYFEWGLNNRDKDLSSQYSSSLDNRHIYSSFDGSVLALDDLEDLYSLDDVEIKPMYRHKFPSPVVKVFDVVRPAFADSPDIPMVILPQPNVANFGSSQFDAQNRVFVNCTDAGSWYALSETSYPMITDGASQAHSSDIEWTTALGSPPSTSKKWMLGDALVGVHDLAHLGQSSQDMQFLDGGQFLPTLDAPEEPQAKDPLREMPPAVEISHRSFPSITVAFTCIAIVATLVAWQYRFKAGIVQAPEKPVTELPIDASPLPPQVQTQTQTQVQTHTQMLSEEQLQAEIIAPTESEPEPTLEESMKAMIIEETRQEDKPIVPQSEILQEEPLDLSRSKSEVTAEITPPQDDAAPKPKKKAHRGQRGGKRDKKKSNSNDADNNDVDKPVDVTDSIVEGAKQSGQDVAVRPDVVNESARNTDAKEPPGLQNLIIKTDKVLGNGSGGTFVFEGEFEGRSVAVKRMLPQYFELASQEVSLLEQSEDHPNVIRYYCRREDQHFLYIALELCQASLWDIFRDGRHDESPDEKFTSLVTAITREPIQILRQMAEGVKYLHDFRIVHRDIKPQNMLIAYPKKNNLTAFPRLVISDFGLCKTLPDGASTLIDATISAELSTSNSQASNSKDSTSGDAMTAALGVKRAVDIFSLGCVFFYVLTRGLHPFDDEEGWMALRERNIKANRCNLAAIELHGRDTSDLIRWMLAPKPEERPTAAEVLAHPFFWNAEDRLEFLSLASDRFDMEAREPPSHALLELEAHAEEIIGPGTSGFGLAQQSQQQRNGGILWSRVHQRSASGSLRPTTPPAPVPPPELNFLSQLDRKFVETLGKQRKYTGSKLVDLLRALRNKHHHWDDMPDDVKARVGQVPEGYLRYWESRFPGLVVGVWRAVRDLGFGEERRFWRWYGGRGG